VADEKLYWQQNCENCPTAVEKAKYQRQNPKTKKFKKWIFRDFGGKVFFFFLFF
jgi:hypothetical protein